MLTEEDKYKSQTFRIFGLALLTLIGNVFLDPLSFFIKYGFSLSVFYILFALMLAFLGFILIDKGRDIISKRGTSKWK